MLLVTAARHHTHGHKMLAELLLNDKGEAKAGHQFKFNPKEGQPSNPGTDKRKRKPYVPNDSGETKRHVEKTHF